ncbi:MAG: NADH-quinone oxidoreductase subunit C [Candidatus Cloacimonetes bacterium]|nr:NADH-quinone oxidoreductase subunit C [Candidatus Cloacimonadota bacterium]
MNIEDLIRIIKEKFPKQISGTEIINPQRLLLGIDKKDLFKISGFLFHDLDCRYIIVSAMDAKEGFELVYHFSHDKSGIIINLDVVIPHKQPEIESLVSLIPGIEWIEREIHDFLGIDFPNHPNLQRLFLAESWEEGNYPYRRKAE